MKKIPCAFADQGCNKTFTRKANMIRHVNTIHKAIKPFKCDYCDKEFARKSDKETHEKNIHLMVKPFKCSFCDKSFSRNSDKNKHEKRHTNGNKLQKLENDERKELQRDLIELNRDNGHSCQHELKHKTPSHIKQESSENQINHEMACIFNQNIEVKEMKQDNFFTNNIFNNNFFDLLKPHVDSTQEPLLIHHDDHFDILSKDGRLLNISETNGLIEHKLDNKPHTHVDDSLSDVIRHFHQHGDECGHRIFQHGDHYDFVVGNELHHIHDDHCHIHGSFLSDIDWDEAFHMLVQDNNGFNTNLNNFGGIHK